MVTRLASLALCVGLVLPSGCGDDGASSLDDYLPETPKPTGAAQSVWAGAIGEGNTAELIPGPATSGMIGDFFMRNSRGRFVIQAPTRVIGVIPQGGNLVDAVALDSDGNDASDDHFGELSLVYLVGRTCRHDSIEVVQDGSGGGAAVVVARGVSAENDFINLRGMGLLGVPLEIDPDIEDSVECATTYILEPDSPTLRVRWTLFNPGDTDIHGPFGAFNDTGGNTESFGPTRGFERLGISALTEATEPAPVEYVVYQGPDVAYGILPRHEDLTTPNASFVIAGVSIILWGSEKLLDILNEDYWFLDLKAGKGLTHSVDVSVGKDAADAEKEFRLGVETGTLSGTVSWVVGSGAPTGARVGVYEDSDNDGQIGDDDLIESYIDIDSDGSFSGDLVPGNYLLRAEVKNVGRSDVQAVTLAASGTGDVSLAIPDPVYFDYSITDDDSSNFIPGKLTVIGRHPAFPDKRIFETSDRVFGVVNMVWSARGTTVVGDDADPQFALPAGGTYRIIATRGTEWSMDSILVTPQAGDPVQTLDFRLRRAAPATDYVSSEYHVHQVGSPDSPVLSEQRVMTAACDGVEFFCSSDHDYVAELQPVIEELGLERVVRSIPGIEVTPFAFGHFNGYPITPDPTTPNNGAVDWAQGMDGYAMIPGEIFGALRSRGAQLVQVNHPRTSSSSITDFMQFFDRAGLTFDYEDRKVEGDLLRQPVPNDWLRLPEASMWSDDFNALEVWNGFDTTDSNEDGVREIGRLDMVLRDWFNFLTFGMDIVPLGNSDTHTSVKDPMGMPRTYVRVADDSAAALENGNIVDDVIDTLAGRNGTPRDVVVTNGPHIMITASNFNGSPLGSVVDGTSGSVTFDIDAYSPAWAEIDTIEIFANETPEVGGAADMSALKPQFCFTTRTGLASNDTCAGATGGARALSVEMDDVGGGVFRYHATASITIDVADVINNPMATGDDAWFVFRVYGTRAIFPMLLTGVMEDGTLDTLVSGDQNAQNAILDGAGVPATAFTSPVYVDFDGGGYTAVLKP